MPVIESLSKGVPVISSTAGAVPEILDVPGRFGDSQQGSACNELYEYEAALNKCVGAAAAACARATLLTPHPRPPPPLRRSLARPRDRAIRIQKYARKYEIAEVVNDLLQFSLDVGRDAGTLIPGEVKSTAALAAESSARWQVLGTGAHVLMMVALLLRWACMRGVRAEAAAAAAEGQAAQAERAV